MLKVFGRGIGQQSAVWTKKRLLPALCLCHINKRTAHSWSLVADLYPREIEMRITSAGASLPARIWPRACRGASRDPYYLPCFLVCRRCPVTRCVILPSPGASPGPALLFCSLQGATPPRRETHFFSPARERRRANRQAQLYVINYNFSVLRLGRPMHTTQCSLVRASRTPTTNVATKRARRLCLAP
jgi:hypothetical protein